MTAWRSSSSRRCGSPGPDGGGSAGSGHPRAAGVRPPEVALDEQGDSTIPDSDTSERVGPQEPVFALTATEARVAANPLGGTWTDGASRWSTRELATISAQVSLPILMPGCLAEPDAGAAMDDRAIAMIPPLRDYLA